MSQEYIEKSVFTFKWHGAPEFFEEIPILVSDLSAVTQQIEDAKNKGKELWYEGSQEDVWVGPYRHHLKKRQDYLTKIFKKLELTTSTKTILDLGCGDGANFSWLSSFTQNIYGSDYNISRLIRAKKRNIAKELALVDITDYAADDNTFDVIFFNHVLEHIPNDIQALSEVYRILKPGGTCILGIPNEGAKWWQLAFKFQPESLRLSDHVHFYTTKSISKKVKEVGFQISELKLLGWGLPHWSYDSLLRQYKFFDDLLEIIGKALFYNQASSMYLILNK